MITSVKQSKNNSDYSKLFEEAYIFLKNNVANADGILPERKSALQEWFDTTAATYGEEENEHGITSIQQYYAHLKDLLDCGGRKFLMVPLDEPYFEIDADKREITVPTEFKKNGISVQGDETAENLIFKVNRFFDIADFGSANIAADAIDRGDLVIRVQWVNAKGEEGLSSAYVIDAEKSADYIYFMWSLTQDVTKYAGTVKFSIRIYKMVGEKLVYSFATKIAAATINSSHDFKVTEWSSNKVDNAETQFAYSVINSMDTGAENAAVPYFKINLDDNSRGVDFENADYKDMNASPKVLEAYIDSRSGYTVQTLRAMANTSDTGGISYQWQYTADLDGGTTRTYILPETIEYLQVADDAVREQDTRYYTKEGENTYKKYSFDEDSEINVGDSITGEGLPTLYIKTTTYKVRYPQEGTPVGSPAGTEPSTINQVVGKYAVTAYNTLGSSNPQQATSYAVTFPAPEVLEFENSLPSHLYLTNGSGDLTVTARADEYGAILTYAWSKTDDITTPYEGILIDESYETSSNTYRATEPGYYKVKVTSTRNYATKSIESDTGVNNMPTEEHTCKVTALPAAPVFTYPSAADVGSDDGVAINTAAATTIRVEIEPINSTLLSEGVTYQWYDHTKTPIEGATEAVLDIAKDTMGSFYCIATNHIGEVTASARSANFNLAPQASADDANTPEG